MNRFRCARMGAVVWACALVSVAGADETPVSLERVPAIHFIAPAGGDRLYLATHAGLYLGDPDGTARRVSDGKDDLVALAQDPANHQRLFASGLSANGAPLGVIVSRDGGRKWQSWAQGAAARVAFQSLIISAADPQRMYAAEKGLWISDDGGRSWGAAGPVPQGLISLAASATDHNTLYAATQQQGPRISRDAGRSWGAFGSFKLPVSVMRSGTDHWIAYELGNGFVQGGAGPGVSQVLSSGLGGHVPLVLATDPERSATIYALSNLGQIFRSRDGGRTWTKWGRPLVKLDASARRGKDLFVQNCAVCHGGEAGLGEAYSEQSLTDPKYLMAPALDDSMHAWHHSDENLVRTILDGSPREPRMQAWKSTLDESQARDIVAYIKSLWGRRAKDCQGEKHMSCPEWGITMGRRQ